MKGANLARPCNFLTMTLMTIAAVVVGCGEDKTEFLTAIMEPDPTFEGCCSSTKNISLHGQFNSGRFAWLALMKGDSVIKHSDSIFLQGTFDTTLSLTFNYRDRIQPGEYLTRVFYSALPEDVGFAAKRLEAAEVDRVTVPNYDLDLCIECDTIEVKFRAFIACEVVDGMPFIDNGTLSTLNGFYGGDAREFGLLNEDFHRSSQVIKIAFNPQTQRWVMANEHNYGQTKKWNSDAVEQTGSEPCPWTFKREGQFTPACNLQAIHGDAHGNSQTETLEQLGTLGKLTINVIGYNPCASPACSFDATAELFFDIDWEGSLPTIYCSTFVKHDRFPWYELYVTNTVTLNSYEVFTWSANDLFQLCNPLQREEEGQWFNLSD